MTETRRILLEDYCRARFNIDLRSDSLKPSDVALINRDLGNRKLRTNHLTPNLSVNGGQLHYNLTSLSRVYANIFVNGRSKQMKANVLVRVRDYFAVQHGIDIRHDRSPLYVMDSGARYPLDVIDIEI